MQLKLFVGKNVLCVRLIFLYVGDMGANEGVFTSALFSEVTYTVFVHLVNSW